MSGGILVLMLFVAGLALAARGIVWVAGDEVHARRAARGLEVGVSEADRSDMADRSPRWVGAGLIVIGAIATFSALSMITPGRTTPWTVRHWRPIFAACIAFMALAVLRARRGRSIGAALALLAAAALLVPSEMLETVVYRITGDARFRPAR